MAKLTEQFVHPKHARLYLQQRSDSRFLQAVAFVDGTKRQQSMKTDHLPTAFRLAEDWYLKLKRASNGERIEKLTQIPILEELYKSWRSELPTAAKKSWAEMKWKPIARFWEARVVTEITPQTFKEFYRWRRSEKTRNGEPPKNHTIHKDVVLIRQILKYALEEGHIANVPAIPKVGTIEQNPRPWLTPSEWEHLMNVSLKRIKEAAGNPRLQQQRQELHDQILWMCSSMMRVDEMLELKFVDCHCENLKDGPRILLCRVNGKRGHRDVVATCAAADIWERRKAGKKGGEAIFPVHHREALTELLKVADLHIDPKTKFERNFKSLRATAISFRILAEESPNLLLIARNAGTSVMMIDQFYARRLEAIRGKRQLGKSVNLKQLGIA